jgi:hypothetical protein
MDRPSLRDVIRRPDQMHTFRMPVGCAGLWEAVRLNRRLDPVF